MKDWCEIFRAGAHVDASGQAREWTEADLDRIVGNYDPQRHEAPIVIGHPKSNAPAFGWVEALKRVGKSVFARFKQVLPEFAELVREGRFKKRSISLYPDGTLRHVGFLGAVPPAIKGLGDFSFSDHETPLDYEEEIQHQQEEQNSMPTVEELQKQLAEETSKREAAEKLAKESSTKLDTLTKDFAEQKAKAKKDGIEAFVDGLINTGKGLPTWKPEGLVEFMAALDEEVTIDFSEGKKESPLAWFKSFLGKLGSTDLFKDFSEGRKKSDQGKPPAADADKAAVEMILNNAPKAAKK